MGFLAGRKILIVGMLSNKSIAYGIAQAMHREGASLAFTYYGEKFEDRVKKLANEFESDIVLPCDVSSDEDIKNVFNKLNDHWDELDSIVHSVAFAPSNELEGGYIDSVTREGFKIAHEISSFSFTALAKAGKSMMQKNDSSLLTLTYLGAERAVKNYNVMGLAKASLEANVRYMANDLGSDNIRVNGLSAGPIRTLAASGIKDFKKMLGAHEQVSPLKRNVSLEDVGNAAAFLCSPLANGITGEILHVDSGYHAVDPLQI